MNNTLSITPEASAALTDLDITDRLRRAKAEIAELRRTRCHLTAGIMRDALLCEVERYLDPDALAVRAEIQSIQGRAAVALALSIDPALGF